jgi:hypothetical protein
LAIPAKPTFPRLGIKHGLRTSTPLPTWIYRHHSKVRALPIYRRLEAVRPIPIFRRRFEVEVPRTLTFLLAPAPRERARSTRCRRTSIFRWR